ncbi:MAG: glycosyltransferase family 2 protein [Hyphomicrobiales bacterium]
MPKRPATSSARATTFRIVVPTYRRPGDLATFLGAVAPQLDRRPNCTLVVVNDGSHDDAYDRAVAPYGDLVDYIAEPENRGVQYARQRGCTGADEDFLVFTDDDCVPEPFWADWLQALVETHPGVDVFCGTTVPVETGSPSLFERFLKATGRTPMPVSTIEGLMVAPHANFACRREMFEQVGGLDMRFSVAEDWNLTGRLLAAGATYVIDRQWITAHAVDQGFRVNLKRWYRYGVGAAHQSIVSRDWRPVAANADGSLTDLARVVARPVARFWRRTGDKPVSRGVRLCFAALEGLFACTYQIGWRRGLRRYSAEYGMAPPVPPMLEDTLAGFVKSESGR